MNWIKLKYCVRSNCLNGSCLITVLICVLLIQESKCFLFVSDKTWHSKCGINRCIKPQEHIAVNKYEHTLNIYRNISILINHIHCAFVNNDTWKNHEWVCRLNYCYAVVIIIVMFIKSEQPAKHMALTNTSAVGVWVVLCPRYISTSLSMPTFRDFMKLNELHLILLIHGKIKEYVILLCEFCLFICLFSSLHIQLGHHVCIYRKCNEKCEPCLRSFLFLSRLL